MAPRLFTIQLLLGICLANVALAASWRVELDGSGDFSDIQPAVDAAAPGDTILIGPGRFDTFHECVAPGWTEEAVVTLLKDDLVLIGSGQEVTIIGTETYYATLNTVPKGICSFDGYSGRIQDLTIENVREGIYWWTGHLEVERCTMRAESPFFAGIFGTFSSASIRDCLIETQITDLDAASAIILVAAASNVDVQNTMFTGGGYGIRVSNQCSGIRIEGCEFIGNGVSISFDTNSSGEVRHCAFNGPSGLVLGASNFCHVVCESLHVDGGVRGVVVAGSSLIEGTNLIIEGTTEAAIQLHSFGTVAINNSHILPAAGWAVECVEYLGDNRTVDMTGNYWGTADADSIDALIIDGSDNPDSHYTVVFEPFALGPVPTEKKSLGSVKSMFR